LKCGAEEDVADYLDWSCEKCRSITKSNGGQKCCTKNEKRTVTLLVKSCMGTAFQNALLEGR